MWVQLSPRARCITLCDKVCHLLSTGLWFSPGPPVSSTNKTDPHDITDISLKVLLSTIKPNQSSTMISFIGYMKKAIMKLPIYFALHMPIGGHIMDIISK